MRFWLSGPRLFGGLIRPGVSFGGARSFGRSGATLNGGTGGFCYVIRGTHGYVKIGSSNDPYGRLSSLQTGSPFPLDVVSTVPVAYDAAEIEHAAHDLLDRHRVLNEWFAVTPEIATAAIYAAADRVGRSLRPLDPSAPNSRQPIASWTGWVLLFILGAYIWRGVIGN